MSSRLRITRFASARSVARTRQAAVKDELPTAADAA